MPAAAHQAIDVQPTGVRSASPAPVLVRWLRCQACGHKLCRGSASTRVRVTPAAESHFEIKCDDCGVLNYLGAATAS
jgi:phage FluMu protein Com